MNNLDYNTHVKPYLEENPETAVLVIGKELDGADFAPRRYVYLSKEQLKEMSKTGLPNIGVEQYPYDVKVFSNINGWDGIVYNFRK